MADFDEEKLVRERKKRYASERALARKRDEWQKRRERKK